MCFLCHFVLYYDLGSFSSLEFIPFFEFLMFPVWFLSSQVPLVSLSCVLLISLFCSHVPLHVFIPWLSCLSCLSMFYQPAMCPPLALLSPLTPSLPLSCVPSLVCLSSTHPVSRSPSRLCVSPCIQFPSFSWFSLYYPRPALLESSLNQHTFFKTVLSFYI